ncbi:hypothetical protein [Duganella violaceipulchra]|uniref:Uncharacterized protein n=1 Tax=Duganella violaceipulchra TaxID=2849652 RepID=A0AA41HK02_9BURK|nr:hypothetical protein [Duganella violaceicalia]MBV6325536.1 hypothetical protein [Duganella violaceicalia]MCP2012123.1 hypothetical protein [Duganella violaceicalia]
MFPISSAAQTTPGGVTPLAESAAVTGPPPGQIGAAGSATEAPAASVTVDLSPVANFLLTVSQSRKQLAQLQTAIARSAAPPDSATALNNATQNVVNAFNQLPTVDLNQTPPQEPSLLANLVQSLQQPAAPDLTPIGLTLQTPVGLALDNGVLQAAFDSNQQATTQTLQTTLDNFNELATSFVQQLSAAALQANRQLNDPLRANPALAAAIAAYHINDTELAGAHGPATQTPAGAIPRVPAVEPASRSRTLDNAP